MFIYIFHEIFTYLLFPTLSFQRILKIPLPVNARFSYPSAITGIFRLMICIVGMKRVTSFSLIHVL